MVRRDGGTVAHRGRGRRSGPKGRWGARWGPSKRSTR